MQICLHRQPLSLLKYIKKKTRKMKYPISNFHKGFFLHILTMTQHSSLLQSFKVSKLPLVRETKSNFVTYPVKMFRMIYGEYSHNTF
ncbi:hypothetical protein HOLleu_41056 [Holothuria leucospilota]|uniref:Uncharacterized protein n=1 Tax=Holothuria leucospilota TaxID=206669 RepID=A0A9Q0YC21_HOLLE|nr:hypothetical protein HOLleu_41056 [Holothuria leucospilota]